jgi:hypothetical protein
MKVGSGFNAFKNRFWFVGKVSRLVESFNKFRKWMKVWKIFEEYSLRSGDYIPFSSHCGSDSVLWRSSWSYSCQYTSYHSPSIAYITTYMIKHISTGQRHHPTQAIRHRRQTLDGYKQAISLKTDIERKHTSVHIGVFRVEDKKQAP